MTAEEIQIIVDANVERALKEFEKLIPAIKQATKQMTEKINSSDLSGFTNKVLQAVKQVKSKFNELKQQNSLNDMEVKVTTEDAKKQITQLKKEIDSLQAKIKSRQIKLNFDNEKIKQMYLDRKPGEYLGRNTEYLKLNQDANKQISDINVYNKLLDEAKTKYAQLEQEINKTKTTQSKLGSFFSVLKNKIEQAKTLISGMKTHFSQMPKITQNITNNIKNMGNGLKQGLGHVLKYVGALLGLRSIYSVLRNSASAWLSSQNKGAQQLSANIEYMKYAMGSVFAPVIEYVINLIYQLMKAIQSVVYAFSGINIFAKATASSMNKTASSAKQANKSLSSIHSEINNVSENNNSGSGTTSPNIDLSKMDNTPNTIMEAIKNGDWYKIGETIGQKLNEAMNSIPWDKIQNTTKNIATNVANFLNGFIKETDWKQVGNTFAQGLNTVIYFGYNFVTTFDWRQFGKAIGDGINGFFDNVDWKTTGKTLSDGVKGVFTTIDEALEEIDWQQLAKDTEDFIKNIDWSGVAKAIFKGIGAALAGITVYLGTLLGDAVNGAKQYFQDKIEECGGNIVEGIFKGIIDAVVGIGQWIYIHIFQPFIEGFKNVFQIHSPSKVMEELGKFIVEGLLNGITSLVGNVSQIWQKMKSMAVETFSNIKTSVVNKVTEIKEGMKSKFQEVYSNTSSTFSKIGNTIGTNLNSIKSNISNWSTNIKNTFTKLGSSATTWGKDLVSNMASGIKNNISKVTNAVNSVASKIKSLLGFSEPEDGPLSNFHTYMPDMIDLMVKGIHENVGKVTKELEELTENMSYTINTPDINPLSTYTNNIINSDVTPQNIMYDTMRRVLEDTDFHNSNDRQSIYLTVQVGNKKLGQILLDDLRDEKRRTGKDIEAIVGG